MIRLEGWEGRLAEVLEAARSQAYLIGEHDCFRLACHVVVALTGVDRWPEFAGYRDRREALLLMARHGRTFDEAFSWFFGAPPASIREARRGDICKFVTSEPHLGVCTGARVAVLLEDGLSDVALSDCTHCWRVG